jgi:hypothetical protein
MILFFFCGVKKRDAPGEEAEAIAEHERLFSQHVPFWSPLALAMGYLTISSEEVGLVASACCSGAVCSTSSWFCGKSTVCSNGSEEKTTGGGMGFATGAN